MPSSPIAFTRSFTVSIRAIRNNYSVRSQQLQVVGTRSSHATSHASPPRICTALPLLPRSATQSRRYSNMATATHLSVEEAKEQAAERAVEEHFDPNSNFVGIGSGTTIVYVVNAIKRKSTNPHIRFVPTGYQSRQVIVKAGLYPMAFDSLVEDEMLDVAFDGADEVDEDLNCIKGGGACLFQEKLVAMRAKKFVCVADYRKDQSRLLTMWPSIPIEVAPISVFSVLKTLHQIGSKNPVVRDGLLAKAGPLKTDQDFFIIDAPFPKLLLSSDPPQEGHYTVEELAKRIKAITGVLDVGIFSGKNGIQALREGGIGGEKPVAVYFGMQDGSVKVRKAKEV